MADDWAGRKSLLRLGATYRVATDAPAVLGPSFVIGELVHLSHIGYSRYDSAYGYTFRADGGVEKSFFLGDDEPTNRLTDTFVEPTG